MRRRIRRRKKQFPVLIIFFVVSLFCFSIGYSLLQERLSITGKGSIVVEEIDDEYFEYTMTQNSWGGEGTYVKQYQFGLTNIKDVEYTSWYGTFKIGENDIVSGCWNVICSVKDGILTIKNESYNANVSPNGILDFGFIIEHVESDGTLENIKFYGVAEGQSGSNTQPDIPSDEPTDEPTYEPGNTIDSTIVVTHKKVSNWVNGEKYIQQLEFNITNNRETTITSWQIDLQRTGYEIDAAYGANFIEMADVLRFSNVDYNGTIGPGQTITFQVVLASTTNSFDINIVNVNGSGA